MHNPLGTVNNAPLASDRGMELHPRIFIIPAMHGGPVNREI